MKEDKTRTLVDALNALFQNLSPQNSSYSSSILQHNMELFFLSWFPHIDAHAKKDPK